MHLKYLFKDIMHSPIFCQIYRVTVVAIHHNEQLNCQNLMWKGVFVNWNKSKCIRSKNLPEALMSMFIETLDVYKTKSQML